MPEGEQRDAVLSGLGKGAVAGGVIALLLGTRTGRKIASPAIKLGSLAALGAIGYKVYKNYQEGQGVEVQDGSIATIEGPAAESRSMGLIKAMIAAAKADGQVDAAETARIVEEIKAANLGDQAATILMTEVQRPLDVDEVASHADSPEAAIEMYLASLVVVDKENIAEKTYLEKLASALKLDNELVQQLETEAFAPA